MKDSTQNFLLYTPEIEAIRANEQEVSAQISDAMRRISVAIGDQFRHTMRPVHAKSHGLLRAKLSIQGDVPEQYRQGLFAEPGTFDAIVRLSTIPGDILPDNVSSPRGWAIKVIGTPAAAAMLPGHEQHHTQDFLCETGKAFGVPDAEAFLKQILFFEKHATDSPTLKEAVSTAARLAESAIETVGGRIETLKKLGYPQTHILGEFFYSQTPLRYGNYIAKIAFVPASKNLVALKDKKLEHPGNHSALRDAVVRFFKTQRAEWNICAQLATDIEKTPVEDVGTEALVEVSAVIVDQVVRAIHDVFGDEEGRAIRLRSIGFAGIEAIHALVIYRIDVRDFLFEAMFTGGIRMTVPEISAGSRSTINLSTAITETYSVPCAPVTSARTGPGLAPFTTTTGMFVPASTPAGTSRCRSLSGQARQKPCRRRKAVAEPRQRMVGTQGW
jgi:hypothetical protein